MISSAGPRILAKRACTTSDTGNRGGGSMGPVNMKLGTARLSRSAGECQVSGISLAITNNICLCMFAMIFVVWLG